MRARLAAGDAYDSIKPGTSMRVPLRPVCTTEAPVKITSVEPWKPTDGIHITSWAVRYSPPADVSLPYDEGGVPASATAVRGFDHSAVRAKCGNEDEVQQFDVSVAATGSKTWMYGAVAHYADGQTAKVQYAVRLCATADCPDAVTG